MVNTGCLYDKNLGYAQIKIKSTHANIELAVK